MKVFDGGLFLPKLKIKLLKIPNNIEVFKHQGSVAPILMVVCLSLENIVNGLKQF